MNMRSLSQAIDRLMSEGFKPYYDQGKLVDFRRVYRQRLQIAKLSVRPSGKVTVLRSSRGNRSDHQGDRQAEG